MADQTDHTCGTLLVDEEAAPGHVDDILERLTRLTDGSDTVAFGRIVAELGARGFAPLLLALSILLVLPIGMLPGVGGAVGGIMAVIGFQVMRGDAGLWLPGLISRREVPAPLLHRALDRIRPATRWLGNHMSRRMTPLARSPASLTVIAVILVVQGLALIVLGFIPVIAPLIGIPILLFALGLVSRDGRAVLAGYLLCLPPVTLAILWTTGT